jgi:alpha-tubulin suppressor-like RCC1 family protein
MPPHRTDAIVALFLVLMACSGSENLGPNPTPASGSVMALGDRHACLVHRGRTLCWGTGTDGQLGIGSTPVDTTPTALPEGVEFVTLAAGQAHTCGLDTNGAAFCWGSDRDGQLGLGASAAERCGAFPCATSPQPVAGNHRFQALTAGHRFTCGLTVDDVVYCWGLNDVGQLGSTAEGESCVEGRCSHTPLAEASGRTFRSITAGLSHVCALDPGGTTYCWGWDGPGGTVAQGHHPTFTPDAYPVEGPTFRQLSAGGYHTCALTSDGSGYCWGIDAIGAGPTQLEAGHPVAVIGGIHFRSIHTARVTTCGLDPEGAAYCWGPNINGEIGREPTGGLERFDEPVAVSGGLRFQTLAPGYSTYCGITEDEAVYCWGRGEFGELGRGDENSTGPVSVPLD